MISLQSYAAELHGIDVAASGLVHVAKYFLIRGGMIMKTFGAIGNLFTRIFGWGGRSSGDERGPRPGDGAVVHHSSGEADFDGLSGNVPPPVKDANRDLPYPPKRSAD
jgi:hypothetical protein